MSRKTALALTAVTSMVLVSLPLALPGRAPTRAADPAKPDGTQAQVALLQAEVKRLQELVPDQAAVMTHVGYHYGNLWAALEAENWPLADFYLSETRNNIKWAVRTKPVRKDKAGKDIDLAAIAQALDNSQLADMKRAIDAKDKARCARLYDEALAGCYACHKASDKPYLRPRRPSAAEVRVINFDPNARSPQ